MSYHSEAPTAEYVSNAQPAMRDYQQYYNRAWDVLPTYPVRATPPPVYPMYQLPDQGVQLAAAMPSVPFSFAMPTLPMPEQVLSPQSPNVSVFVFPLNPPLQPLPIFPSMDMTNAQFCVPPTQNMYVSPSPSPSPPGMRQNKRTASDFENHSYRAPTCKTNPLYRSKNEGSSIPRSRRCNAKRKAKMQIEKLSAGEYRPSYRSKQDMIDKVFLALSQKYTACGLLENKGLRGDDTIRVHVKNFKALARIEEALIAVESHPKVKVSRVSLPFSFRNEFQKKGFLVYLKLEDVTMVPHAQSVFRQYNEFQKCGVMRETGQYVESLPLEQATKSKEAVSEPDTPRWNPSAMKENQKSTPDYASSTESASSDSEQLLTVDINKSFGPLTALASTRQQAILRNTSEEADNLTMHALMRVARSKNEEEKMCGFYCISSSLEISPGNSGLCA